MPRRRRRPPPRCQHCNARITFLIGPAGGRYLPFDERPVDPGSSERAYPVLGRKAWDRNELIAEIQVMRGCDVDAAVAEVNDVLWRSLHRCTPGTTAWMQRNGIETRTT